jgi:hypothetical protein
MPRRRQNLRHGRLRGQRGECVRRQQLGLRAADVGLQHFAIALQHDGQSPAVAIRLGFAAGAESGVAAAFAMASAARSTLTAM